MRSRIDYLLLSGGLISLYLYFLLGKICSPQYGRDAQTGAYILLSAALLLIMALVFLYSRSISGKMGDNSCEKMSSMLDLCIVIVFAMLFRLILIRTEPLLDNDAYRYFWEGRVQTEGKSPYALPPQSRELAELRDSYYDHVDYKNVPSCYPPLAQILFHKAYVISGGEFFLFKFTIEIFDILNIFLIFYLLSKWKKPHYSGILYAWNPVVIKEFSNSGHYDAVPITFFIITLILIARNRWTASALTMGICIALKPFALPILPLLWAPGKRAVLLWTLAAVTAVIPFLIYYDQLGVITEGMRIYFTYWEFNSGPFLLLKGAAALYSKAPLTSAKYLFMALLALLVSFLTYISYRLDRAPDSRPSPLNLYLATIMMGFYLLFNPVVNPWYLIWIIPLLVLFPSTAWIYFFWSVNLSYLFAGESGAPAPLLILEFLPVIAIWAAETLFLLHPVRQWYQHYFKT